MMFMGSTKLARRLASDIIQRGERSIRIKPSDVADVEKALTRDDVRALIKKGSIYALKVKRNASTYGRVLKKKRSEGRKRGRGKRKGTAKARGGVSYQKRIRAQRRVLKALKSDGTITNELFKKYYRLTKGGVFASKMTLISHIRNDVQMSDQRVAELKAM